MSNDWTLVKKSNKKIYKLFDLTIDELKNIDNISKTIFIILKEFTLDGKGVPASFITKELNNRLESDFNKKDIGLFLYEGPLSCYLIKDISRKPTLWYLPRKIKVNE